MKCPNDGAVLTMSERSGVEIDYCPECRGVWLDRGELDKILDRVAAEVPAVQQRDYEQRPQAEYRQSEYRQDRQPDRQPDRHQDRWQDQGRGSPQGGRKPKRKEHWLTELFD